MTLFVPLKIAYKALKVHKARSMLTILGLTIGIISIIVVMNTGLGLEGFIMSQMDMFGTDYIDIEPQVPKSSRASMFQASSITTLTVDDAEAVAEHPNVRDYYYGVMGQKIVSYLGENKNILLFGMSAPGFDLYGPKVEYGRPFTEEEDKSLAKVAVLASGLPQKLFGNDDPLGKRIKIGKDSFRVVGVMEEQGMAGPMNMDEMIFIPVTTLQKQVMGINHIQFIMAFLKDTNLAEQTAEELKLIMRDQHDITDPDKDDFQVVTTEEALSMIGQITGGVTLLLIAIAGISLLVGGVGIMNIMYVSVSERTYEIGLRKALGATQKDIMWQFLWEAMFLTFLGGLIGVVLGTLFTQLALIGARYAGFDFGNLFSLFGVLLGVGFSVLVGLIFGIYPARKAAKMDPVVALTHE